MDLAQRAERVLQASPAERFATIARLFVEPRQTLDDLVFLAMYLRDHGEIIWAKSLFILCCDSPDHRTVAQYELGILLSQNDDLPQAIALFDQLRDGTKFSDAQTLFMARQYARLHRFDDAYQLIESVYTHGAAQYADILAEYQFFTYLQDHPYEKALSALAAEQSEHRLLDFDAVIATIVAALDSRTPYSLIRLGDGEGLNLSLSLADESRFGALYRRGRREFHAIWYGGHELLDNDAFLSEMYRVQAAYTNADCLSIMQLSGLKHEYAIGSPRGIPALHNMTRFLQQRRLMHDQRLHLCEANIHRGFLLSGFLSALLRGRRFVGLVSCYADLPRRLRQAYGIDRTTLIQTGGEMKARQSEYGASGDVTNGAQFLDDHAATLTRFGDVEAGELYLVAAGIFGKIYCDIIKKQGGIAIDIGSVVDIWMQVATRSFSPEEMRFAL